MQTVQINPVNGSHSIIVSHETIIECCDGVSRKASQLTLETAVWITTVHGRVQGFIDREHYLQQHCKHSQQPTRAVSSPQPKPTKLRNTAGCNVHILYSAHCTTITFVSNGNKTTSSVKQLVDFLKWENIKFAHDGLLIECPLLCVEQVAKIKNFVCNLGHLCTA